MEDVMKILDETKTTIINESELPTREIEQLKEISDYDLFDDSTISHDDIVNIINGSTDLARVCSALFMICDALDHKDLYLEKDLVSCTIRLVIEKIETIYMNLKKIEFK